VGFYEFRIMFDRSSHRLSHTLDTTVSPLYRSAAIVINLS